MFIWIIVIGVILYFVLRGKGDRAQLAGAPKRAMGQGPIETVKFVCPYPKCASCGAPGDGMKQEWDGMRAVKWSCGSCGTVAGVQELRDEDLPLSARRRLGLDQPPMGQGQGYANDPWAQGGGVGSLLTGMMIGSMMSGGERHHHHDSGDWNSGSSSDSGSDSGFSEGGNESWGDGGSSDSGGDWGDSGGGDSGGDW